VRLCISLPAFARCRAPLAQTHSGRPAGFGRCSVLPFVAGDTWLSEIRVLFFARTYWGQDKIQPFAGSGWPLKDDQDSAVSCYDTKETFVCDNFFFFSLIVNCIFLPVTIPNTLQG